MKTLGYILILTLMVLPCYGQMNTIEDGVDNFNIIYTNDEITLDGKLDEEVWSNTSSMTNFSQYFPSDTTRAVGQTELYMAYDDEFLYVAAVCHSIGNEFVVKSMKRDYGFSENDNISFMFDTFNDNTNAFLFGINAIGARREALISGGGRVRSSFDSSWDSKWYGDAKIYEDENKWIGEIAIPFKAIRFNEKNETWRFNCYRRDLQTQEITTFITIPRNRILMNMNFMSNLVWETKLEKPKTNFTVIPFVSGSVTRDFEDLLETGSQFNYGIGGDVKIGLSSSMNLDLTVNPDFSQVEVDQQVTNLDRFEIFFPEKRQFFQENADLFGGFGTRTMNPFFSRRIGIALDTSTDINIQNTIHYGARLTGKLNDNLRIGVLNMQTASDKENDLPTFNYSILALEQKVGRKSSLAFIGINKQSINNDDFAGSNDPYNRVGGAEYRFASEDERLTGKVSYMHALSASEKKHNYAHMVQMLYSTRDYGIRWNHNVIGDGFDAELGFVPRRDIFYAGPEAWLQFYPEDKRFSTYTFGLQLDNFYKLGKEADSFVQDFRQVDQQVSLYFNGSFQSNARLRMEVNYNKVFLLDDFDPTRLQEDDVFLLAGTDYKFWNIEGSYNSDRQKIITYNIRPSIGQFYNGFRYGTRAEVNYRYQPYGTFGINVNYNRIVLDDPFEPVNLWLIGPQMDLTFSKTLFLSTFIQYNNQSDNLNLNARFQWRYSPASDFFIVYTDNYLTNNFDQFDKRNRAVVMKLTYWLNL